MTCKECKYSEETEKTTWIWCQKHGRHVKKDGSCGAGDRPAKISAEFAKLMTDGEIQVRWKDERIYADTSELVQRNRRT